MQTRLLKKHILLCAGFLLLATSLFGSTVSAQLMTNGKSLSDTLVGTNKECPYIGKGWYKPFSNIRTDFVLFKEVLNLKNSGKCLVIAGSVDNIVFMMFRIFIGAASVLAVIYIAIAGITMITEQSNIQKRITSKDMLRRALIGLLLSVTAWVLLYTINRRLVEFSFNKALDSSGIPQRNAASEYYNQPNIDVTGTISPYGTGSGNPNINGTSNNNNVDTFIGPQRRDTINDFVDPSQTEPPLPGDPNNNNTGNTPQEEPDSLPNPYGGQQPNQGNNNSNDDDSGMNKNILLENPE